MKLQRCKGMRDLSPEEMAAFRYAEGVFRQCCDGWGYHEVRTPTIEYLHLFTSAGTLTPGMLGRVYSFLDWDGWSGERVVLRPDGTIPVARLYTEAQEDKGLARLYYATSIFIFEETGEKTRERWQGGAELIGAGSPLADAELILLAGEVLSRLGIKNVEMRLSHAGLVRALLAKLGLDAGEQHRMFDRILDGDTEALSKVSGGRPEMESAWRSLLGMQGQSAGFLRNLKALLARDMPEISPYLDDFMKTVSMLDAMKCGYRIDIASGAGFEYYTGMIFQLYAGGEKIGGGGRYDALIPAMGGGDVPASGFALYFDRLMEMMGGRAPGGEKPARITVRLASEGAVKEAFGVAGRLREAGYIAELDLDGGRTVAGKVIEVRAEAPLYTVKDASGKKMLETSGADEALKLLEGNGGSEDSPA